MLDVLRDFSTDIQSQPGLPAIEQSAPLINEPSIRFRLNNPDEQAAELSGPLTYLTGEINVQISHQLGTNDFVMYQLAGLITSIYKRPYKVGETQVLNSRTSSVYSSESNQHISVIISFIAISA